MPADLINVISILGGLFAIYLAWGLWQNWRGEQNDNKPHQDMIEPLLSDDSTTRVSNTLTSSGWRVLRRGALMNVLSPGPYTFWAFVSGPIVLEALKTSPANGSVFFIGFYCIFIGGMLSMVMLFHLARRLGPRVVRILTLISILILAIFSAVLILQGFSGLLT